MGQLWARWREVVIAAVVFVLVLCAGWAVCAAAGHPHDGANRWAVCVALAVVVATAAAVVLHKESQHSESSSARGLLDVEGEDNRVAGQGASGNTLGNRSSLRSKVSGSGRPRGSAVTPDGSEDQGIRVRGNRNRVAGAGAYDNDFGDDPDPQAP